jgi:hypothetical protein
MATISVTFQNGYGESRRWVIQDIGIDQNSPLTVFDGYLGPGDLTDSLSFYSDGSRGIALYQRSDGPATRTDVRDGDRIDMS